MLRNIGAEIGQDGGVEGYGNCLLSQMYKKFMYKWNSFHSKLTGNWQNEHCTTRIVRLTHNPVEREEKWSEWSEGNNCWNLQSSASEFRDSPDICLLLKWAESPHGVALLQHSPSLEQRSWCGERGKYTLKRKRASLILTLRASVLATWDQTQPLIGWWHHDRGCR